MNRLAGRVAIVTGGASGIGRALALGFGRESARVVIADRDVAGGEATVAAMRDDGGMGQFIAVDVASTADVRLLVTATVATFGRLDAIMVNAGVNRAAPALDVTEADWDAVVNVNLRGAFFCAQAAARHMVTAGGGSIVFTSSQLADFPRRRMPAYIASKAGLLGLTRALALEWGPQRVRVNAIQPGVIATSINAARRAIPAEVAADVARTALGRLGEPEDLVGMAVFLACDESAYVTGAAFRVDGGWLGP
jgi:NAD(P)-dependent dehydrogenase (short-subunit alcohol dehydrogenase family)